MSLRNRGGRWHYRFKFQGREYAETTDLAATERNRSKAQEQEVEHRQALREGRNPERKVRVRQFSDGVDGKEGFLEWAAVEYQQHPNSARRIKVSMTSAKEFFGQTPVSLIDGGRIEAYKTWRSTERTVEDEEGEERSILPVRGITLRHDLHALSLFFQFAMRNHWTNRNPVAEVDIPSDKEAVRIHVLTLKEEQDYFARAAKHPDLHDFGRLVLNQGMRPEEVTELAKADVDLDRGQLHIRSGKTAAARRTLTLTPESKSILARRLKKFGPWIFPSPKKRGQHIKRLNGPHDKLKPGFVLYDLRHTFGTRAAQHGIDLATLAAIMGHSSLRAVMKYVHPTAEHQKAAMERYSELLLSQQTESQAKEWKQ